MSLSEEPFDRALEIRKPPQKVREAAIRVNDDLDLCAKIYEQISGRKPPKGGWPADDMAHILAIYDRFDAEKGRKEGDPRRSPLRG
jgi:hypothetical protein